METLEHQLRAAQARVAELDAWQKERIEEESSLAKAYGDAIRSRHELAAVIEEAKAATKRGNVLTPDWVIEVLETADTAAVLAEHDREVAAKALEDAADDIEFRAGKWMEHRNATMRSNGEAEASWWLVTRAAAIRGG